jgi:hypothetical protein
VLRRQLAAWRRADFAACFDGASDTTQATAAMQILPPDVPTSAASIPAPLPPHALMSLSTGAPNKQAWLAGRLMPEAEQPRTDRSGSEAAGRGAHSRGMRPEAKKKNAAPRLLFPPPRRCSGGAIGQWGTRHFFVSSGLGHCHKQHGFPVICGPCDAVPLCL